MIMSTPLWAGWLSTNSRTEEARVVLRECRTPTVKETIGL